MKYISSIIIKPDLTLTALDSVILWLPTETKSNFDTQSICNQANITLINQVRESIKIKTVREIKAQLAYGTYQVGQTRYLIFLDAQLLTIPAQNALLKSIEEPPTNTQLVFVTQTPEKLLETIRSRCQMIHIIDPNKSETQSELKTNEIKNLFSEIINSNPGQKITIAANYKEREDSLSLCNTLLKFLHTELSNPKTEFTTKQLTHNLKILLKTITYLEHNTNAALTLENCFFELQA